MSTDKIIEMQHHIRENASDLQSYLVELADWEKEMKRKDNELKRKKGEIKTQDMMSKSQSVKLIEEIPNANDSESNSLQHKTEGNLQFKNGNYEAAIRSYSKGLVVDAKNSVLLANRAMAYLKAGQPELAERDCSLCISLDETYIKAFHRRGIAYTMLKNYAEAKNDFETVLKLEPNNKQAEVELKKIQNMILEPTVLSNVSEQNVHQDDSNVCPLHNKEFEETFVELKVTIVNSAIQEISSDADIERPGALSVDLIEGSIPKLPPVPEKSYQFFVDWVALKRNPELQFEYLKQFNPQNIAMLFKHSMEAELFSGILRILNQFLKNSKGFNSEKLYSYLKNLTKVGRFQMLMMLLSKDERKDLNDLMNYLKETPEYAEKVKILEKEYD